MSLSVNTILYSYLIGRNTKWWGKCAHMMECQNNAHSLTHSSRSLNDRWGIKDNRTTTFLHSSLSSAFQRASSSLNPVHSDILSSYLFLCLPFLLPPCIVLCRIIFASPVDLAMCPYHLNLSFFTLVIRSSYGQITCLIAFLTSSFITWSL